MFGVGSDESRPPGGRFKFDSFKNFVNGHRKEAFEIAAQAGQTLRGQILFTGTWLNAMVPLVFVLDDPFPNVLALRKTVLHVRSWHRFAEKHIFDFQLWCVVQLLLKVRIIDAWCVLLGLFLYFAGVGILSKFAILRHDDQIRMCDLIDSNILTPN